MAAGHLSGRGRIAILAAAILLAAAAQAAKVKMVESPIQARGPQGPLRGTLLSPAAGARAAVLIIPGSGPTDRDGNSPLGVNAAPYRRLAEALAADGVASVRIDKRGMFASAGAVPDPDQVTLNDYASDVRAWVDKMRSDLGAPCVFLLGHSEGGLVALLAAQRPRGVCGLILVSTPGRPLGEVLREQLKANPANAPILDDADKALSALEAGRRVDVSGLNPALLPLFRPSVQGFLISMLTLDPATLLAAYKGPVAIVQGDADLQVGLADARRLKAADPAATLTVLSGVNHVLKVPAGPDRAANLAAYADPGLPLAPGVANAVLGLIKAAS